MRISKEGNITITINGKLITLSFASEANTEAADFIKKALINAYIVKGY
jgi:hypothetical protein